MSCTKNRLSDNVGGVKQNWDAPRRALKQERHFALVEIVPFQPSSHVIVSGQELDPTHASLRSATPIMITSSDSPVEGSRTPNQFLGVVVHTIAISGLSCVRTELFCCS